MKINKRLQKIVDLTPKTKSIADIGTDHGYVPIELLKKGIIQKAIATDINEMPLDKAMINAEFEGVAEKMDFRRGSGLTVLKKGEVNGVVIAGMGGNLIKEILQKSIDIVQKLDFLILQPAQNPEILREYIYSGKFSIIKEDLEKEIDGRFYEYFLIKYNEEVYGFSKNPFEFEMSPILVNDRNPLLREYITSKLTELKTIKNKLDLNSAAARVKNYELDNRIKKYEEILKWQ